MHLLPTPPPHAPSEAFRPLRAELDALLREHATESVELGSMKVTVGVRASAADPFLTLVEPSAPHPAATGRRCAPRTPVARAHPAAWAERARASERAL